MKTKLDKGQSNIKEPIKQHYSWAKGFLIGGKRVWHPYTLINQS